MIFRTLRIEDMPLVLEWREKCPEALRTPFQLTLEQQYSFYNETICDRQANARFWAIEVDCILIGMAGLENINWINQNAEISIILDSRYRNKGFGEQAVKMLIDKGFGELNLNKVKGEVYECNKALGFWRKMCLNNNGRWPLEASLEAEKYWQGKYYNSWIFEFLRKDWNNVADHP